MTEKIQQLIESLRLGDYEDPADQIQQLSDALVDDDADVALLLRLLRAPEGPLRLAAMDACRGRTEPELWAEMLPYAVIPDYRVRRKLADILSGRTDQGSTEALRKLLQDSEGIIRAAAISSTAGRPEFRTAHENLLAKDDNWNARLAAAAALDQQESPDVVKPLASAIHDDDRDVGRRCAEAIERRFRESRDQTIKHLPDDVSQLSKMESRLKDLGTEVFPTFTSWLAEQTSSRVDPAALTRFGTDLTALAQSGKLPRAHLVEERCETALKLLRQAPARSIALLGPAGVGKSALVNELVYRLNQPEYGWRVLRVSPSDFMSGTKYLGEWESKLRDLIEAIRKPRRVLLYIPNLSELSAAGTWSKSDNSVATALAPYLEDGSVIVLGESAPEEYERGLGKVPSLRRLFEKVLMQEPDIDRTRNILGAVRDEERSTISNELIDQLLEVSGQFLSHISRPGNAVELLQTVIKVEKTSGRVLAFRDVLDALSRSTGIPSDLLDDSVPLKMSEAREFFETRIVGQSKAVDAVIDLVTLIKAGVTDPNRPFGVFMFVGPTGVGKTELARALAEFIFGDASRMKRFDMSEFANNEGFTRLIGNQHENGILTDAVRQNPFSLVLLDEIEKAHINVFDLCLQIFDAGRLTDGRGRTVDFRRTIIVLTSNVGATMANMGFRVTGAETSQKTAKDKMPRELSRYFRPEFLNRLDRIIQFRPLSLEVAEQIARREIQSVLHRSGIRRRRLAVDLDPSVVSLIVKEGYSPQFGARPLKRTVERLLLLPLAKAITSGSLDGCAVVSMTQHSGRIQVTVTLPPTEKGSTKSKTTPSTTENAARLAELQTRYASLEDSIRALTDRKSGLIAQTRESSFSRNAEQRTSVLSEIHNLEQFLSFHEEIGHALKAHEEQKARASSRSVEREPRDEMVRLSRDVDHLALVARCKDPGDLGDALLTISLLDRTGEPQGATQKITGMYQALASRQRMSAEILGEFYSDNEDRVYVLIGGLGAYGVLKHEAGLHQVDRRYKQRANRSNREVFREDRELLRVEVNFAPHEPSSQLQRRAKTRVSALKPVRSRLLKADLAVNLFDESILRSVEFWTTGPKDSAVARGLLILSAYSGTAFESHGSNGVIRQYDVGLAPRVKDTRTGRMTTRVHQVLKGDLDMLQDS